MNKNLIYSAMGLAALPIGANAAEVQSVSFQQNQWQGTGLTIENGVIMSTGATVTYSVGKLLPGSYVFRGQLTTRLYPVKVNIAAQEWTSETGDDAQDVEIAFTLTAETDVTLTLATTGRENTIGAGAEFTLGNPSLKLDFDFAAAKETLSAAASAAKTAIQAYTYGNSTELNGINTIISTVNGITESYADYQEHELYLVADENSTIQKNIEALKQTAEQKQAAYDEQQRKDANTAQFNAVNQKILGAKNYYNHAKTALEEKLVGVAAYLQAGATDELNALNRAISNALTANSQKNTQYAAEGVYSDAEAQAIIETIPTEAQFQAVVDDYIAKADAANTAYSALEAKVTSLQTALNAVVINGNVSAQFTQQKANVQAAITAIDEKVKNIKGKSDPALLDITADVTAAQALIEALQEDANEANAEYNANEATVGAIAEVQGQLDAAKAVLKDLKYGDVAVSSKYTSIVSGLQAQIDALTTAASQAYENNTARQYNQNLNTAGIETDIDELKTKSLAAYNRYVELAPKFQENIDAIASLRSEYEKNTAIYATDKNNRDFKFNLDILLKDVNELDDDFKAAVAKSGYEHYEAIMAITADAELPTRLAAEQTAMACCMNDYNAKDIFSSGSGKTLQDKINTFNSTYTAANMGSYHQGLKDREDDIQAALNAVKASIEGTDTYSETVANIDRTEKAGTGADAWKAAEGNNSNKGLITKNGVNLVEHYGDSSEGTMLSQEITGLEDGVYNVELYALSHNAWDNYGATLQTSSYDVAHVFAQGENTVTAKILARKNSGVEADEPVAYALNGVVVKGGKLTVGLAVDQAGMCEWHAINVKSLSAVISTADRIEDWKTQIAALDEQQTQLQDDAAPIKTAVTGVATTKSGLQTNINTLQTTLNSFESTYGYEDDANTKLGLRKTSTFETEQALENDLEALAAKVDAVSDTDLSGDYTDKVGTTADEWVAGEIAHDGNKNRKPSNSDENAANGIDDTFVEQWSNSTTGANKIGTLITQTVSGLPNGKYNLEVYAFASLSTTGSVQVRANGKTQPVPLTGRAEVVAVSGIDVTDGTLQIVLEKLMGGTVWHGIKIKSLTGVYTEANATKLSELNTDFNGLSNRQSELATLATSIANEVKANADAYKYIYQYNTSGTAYYNNNPVYLGTYETSTLRRLGNDNNYGRITNDYGAYNAAGAKRNDPADWYIFRSGLDANATYEARKAAIDADIDAMKAKVQASYEAETLVADYKNGTIGGYSVATIKAAIDKLKADVATEKANWDAYYATKIWASGDNYWDKLNAELTTAGDGLATAAGGAAEHYNTVYNGYADETQTLYNRIVASLNARTMEKDKAGYVTSISNLRTKVNSLKDAAAANLAKYNQQTNAWMETQTLWNTAYGTIEGRTVGYSTQKDYLARLNDIQTEIDEAILKAEGYFNEGKAVEKAAEIDFADMKARINALVAEESEGYVAAVTADNQAHHDAFVTELGLASKALTEARAEIQKNSSSNEQIAGSIYDLISEYVEQLNGYETQLNEIETNENTAFTTVVSPASYTQEEVNTFVGQANAVKANIVNAQNQFKADVQETVTTLWTEKEGDYNAKVADAENQISAYSAEARQDAFKTVKEKIANGHAAATLVDVAAALDALADIDEQIADCVNEAAKKDIQPRIDDIDVDADREAVTAYGDFANSASFEATVTDYYTAAVNRTNERYEAGTLAASRTWIINRLDQYRIRVNNILAQAESNKQADEANTAAYNEMAAATATLRTHLETAQQKVALFVYSTRDFASNAQAVANQEKANEEALNGGWAADDREWAVNDYIPQLEQEILDELSLAFAEERTGLGEYLPQLKNLFNEYVAANGLDDKALEYQAAINSSEKTLSQTETLAELSFDEAIAACDDIIAVQDDIAELETAMNAEASSQALTALTNRIGELRGRATLDGKDEWVGKQTHTQNKTVSEWIADINERINSVETAIAAEQNLAFYKGRYETMLEEIETDLNSVITKIDHDQAQVEADAAAYEEYKGIIDGLSDRAAAARERVTRYSGTDYRTSYINSAERDIAAVTAELERRHGLKVTQSFQLNGYSFGFLTNSISNNISTYLEYRANDELNAEKEKLVTNLANAIGEGSDKYSQALWNNLVAQEAAIDADINALATDIANSPDLDADYEDLMVRVREIQDAIDALASTVENMNLVNGDADMSGKVDVLDYQLVSNWILKPEAQPAADSNAFLLADVNTNETIDVGDLTGVVNIIMGRQWDVAAARGMNAERESVGMQTTMTEQGTQRIAISLDNVRDYTAFQLDLVLPQGMNIVGKDLTSRAADSHSLLCRKQQDGSVRFLASSILGETFKGTEGDVLYIDVQTGEDYAGGDAEVVNILFSEANSNVHAFAIGSEATGIETASVLDSLKQQVYTLGGKLMNSLKKGVNIIRRADGKTEKVIK